MKVNHTYAWSMFLDGTNHLLAKFEFTGSVNQAKRLRKSIAKTNNEIYANAGGVFLTVRKSLHA